MEGARGHFGNGARSLPFPGQTGLPQRAQAQLKVINVEAGQGKWDPSRLPNPTWQGPAAPSAPQWVPAQGTAAGKSSLEGGGQEHGKSTAFLLSTAEYY